MNRGGRCADNEETTEVRQLDICFAIIKHDDTLVFYGRKQIIEDLDSRRAGQVGNWQHVQAVEEELHVQAEKEADVSD